MTALAALAIMPAMKVAYSVPEAADMLSVSASEVRRLVSAGLLGRIPHTGKRVLIAHAELERFASAGVLDGAAA